MWSKDFRQIVITVIYSILFEGVSLFLQNPEKVNKYGDSEFLEALVDDENLDSVEQSDLLNVLNLVKYFLHNYETLTKYVDKYLKDERKTNIMARAIFISLLLEVNTLKGKDFNKKKLISNYLRQTENLGQENNIALVHSVGGKLIEDSL